jgi:hypothetical protein
MEKNLQEIKDLMASHFKSAQDVMASHSTSAKDGVAPGIVSQADPPPPSVAANFPQGKKPLSGSVRSADSRAPKSFVLWPQELGLHCDGANPPKYDSLSLERFVQGFIATSLVAPRSQLVHRLKHLQEIMEDTQLRDWPRVRAYHKVFMHNIEQGTAQWAGCSDLKASLKMRYIYSAESGFHLDSSDLITDSVATLQIKTIPISNVRQCVSSETQSHFHSVDLGLGIPSPSVNDPSVLDQPDGVDCIGAAISYVDQQSSADILQVCDSFSAKGSAHK